ncbi:MAG TPA: ATP-binding cassette domain-containing protein [Verrucomicrobiae bacterium]|jgi:ABC-type transporter Mla maintaining outer membrane lipid asymmetry ATPase subunit MlaF|nr:ATP-binding cassette domain-containing protein [Verrucomicrobiae bacterium]
MEENSQHAGAQVEAVDASIARPRSHHVLFTHVNWRVNAGEFWVVGGRQGSGKTSFLSTMAGLRRTAAGEVRHFGEDLSRLSEPQLLRQRARVGFVFKSGGRMFAGLTVAENVALPLCYHREWTEEEAAPRVDAILRATELESEASATAQTLGWGWQQRVGLARALALNPEVLFLDEPLSGLEARDRQWWRGFLDTLSQGSPITEGRKMTIITSTNDFGLWIGGNHRCGVLGDGNWQLIGEHEKCPDII